MSKWRLSRSSVPPLEAGDDLHGMLAGTGLFVSQEALEPGRSFGDDLQSPLLFPFFGEHLLHLLRGVGEEAVVVELEPGPVFEERPDDG